MDKIYEILEHPADLKIRAFGKDLPEVFVNTAKAIAEQQALSQDSAGGETEKIEIRSDDLNSLLVDWLNEILYRGEINKKVYTDFDIAEFSEKPYKIKAEVRGVPIESKNADIKAVTYHELEIKKINNHWEAIVVFDI